MGKNRNFTLIELLVNTTCKIYGMPVCRYAPMAASVVQFNTTQPTSMGSFPLGTVLPVV